MEGVWGITQGVWWGSETSGVSYYGGLSLSIGLSIGQ